MNRQDFYDGKLFDAYRYMGAHKDGDKIRFVTYAPRASRISIIGEFNDWNEEFMEQDAQSGFFLFYSDKAKEGQMYKYCIYGPDGNRQEHCDPYGFEMELRPGACSIIRDITTYQFHDDSWMQMRSVGMEDAVNVYEMHMVASGMTAKGLNGIEAEANKLAKAPKGIDGVTEGAGNLAEDVGKAGKGLEGAAKGAESAAEDAGKVVESGSSSGKVWDYSKQFDGELANFNAGYEIKNVIKEDLYLVQFHSNAEVGSGRSLKYWTTFDAANRISTVDDYMNQMALLSNWGARDNVSIAKIPAGTKIKYAIGTAKEQVGAIESILKAFTITDLVIPTRSAILLATRIPSSPSSSSKIWMIASSSEKDKVLNADFTTCCFLSSSAFSS